LRNKCECMPGWQGHLCELPCLEGTFGIECSQYCQCGGANCNSITGECLCLNGATKCEDENCLKGLFLINFLEKNTGYPIFRLFFLLNFARTFLPNFDRNI